MKPTDLPVRTALDPRPPAAIAARYDTILASHAAEHVIAPLRAVWLQQ